MKSTQKNKLGQFCRGADRMLDAQLPLSFMSGSAAAGVWGVPHPGFLMHQKGVSKTWYGKEAVHRVCPLDCLNWHWVGVEYASDEARVMLNVTQSLRIKGLKDGEEEERESRRPKEASVSLTWLTTNIALVSFSVPRREREAAVWDQGILWDCSCDSFSFGRTSLAPGDMVGIG